MGLDGKLLCAMAGMAMLTAPAKVYAAARDPASITLPGVVPLTRGVLHG